MMKEEKKKKKKPGKAVQHFLLTTKYKLKILSKLQFYTPTRKEWKHGRKNYTEK